MVNQRSNRSLVKQEHPTRRILIDSTSALLDKFPVTEITSDQVLYESGVSKGSMYHFFSDFNQLLEETQVERFRYWADSLISNIEITFSKVDSLPALKDALSKVMSTKFCPTQKESGIENFRALGIASGIERFGCEMASIQDRISFALNSSIGLAIANIPNAPKKITSEKLTLLVELWICGQSIGHFHKTPVESEQWCELTNSILDCILQA